MQLLSELQIAYKRYLLGLASYQELIAWGINRLQADEEGDDLDVVLLASTDRKDEASSLALEIILRYAKSDIDLGFVIGKELIAIRSRFKEGNISLFDIDKMLTKFYRELDYAGWFTMLYRNCAIAADTENFVQSFSDELDYICSLWERCSSFDEFNAVYDRAISNSHDFK
jgi:hypothetical protein